MAEVEIGDNLSMKQTVFGILLIIVSLVMFYCGLFSSFETISSSRFILGAIFVSVLAVALFKHKVNTKPMGIILLMYLILDALLVVLGSASVSMNLIFEVIFIIIAVYFVFMRKK
jgi:hypothetical protein